MRAVRALALCAIAALALAGPAAGTEPGMGDPETVGPAQPWVTEGRLALRSPGDPVVSWRVSPEGQPRGLLRLADPFDRSELSIDGDDWGWATSGAGAGHALLTRQSGGRIDVVQEPKGGPASTQVLSSDGGSPVPITNSNGDAAVVFYERSAQSLVLARREVTGEFGSPVSLGVRGGRDLDVALGRDGSVVLVWRENSGTDHRTRVVAARVRPGEATQPQALTEYTELPRDTHPRVALDAGGRAVVAWQEGYEDRGNEIKVAVAAPEGPFGNPVKIGEGDDYSNLDLGASDAGRVLVTFIDENNGGGNAVLGSTAGDFSEPADLDPRASARVLFSGIDAQGRAVVAWDDGPWGVAYAWAEPQGGFAVPHDLACGSGILLDAAIAGGEFAAIWVGGEKNELRLGRSVAGRGPLKCPYVRTEQGIIFHRPHDPSEPECDPDDHLCSPTQTFPPPTPTPTSTPSVAGRRATIDSRGVLSLRIRLPRAGRLTVAGTVRGRGLGRGVRLKTASRRVRRAGLVRIRLSAKTKRDGMRVRRRGRSARLAVRLRSGRSNTLVRRRIALRRR